MTMFYILGINTRRPRGKCYLLPKCLSATDNSRSQGNAGAHRSCEAMPVRIGTPKSGRFYWMAIYAAAVLFFVIGAYLAVRVLHEYGRPWAVARVPNADRTNTDELNIEQGLGKAGNNDHVVAGTHMDIVDLRQPNAPDSTITVVEGRLMPDAIKPDETWKHLGNPLWIYSSVDENQRTYKDSISSKIAGGCHPTGGHPQLHIGQFAPHGCSETANYVKYGIVSTIDLVLFVGKSLDSQKPCKIDVSGIDCEKPVLTRALLNSFYAMEDAPPEGVIIPALATGPKVLPKDAFYDSLEAALAQAFVNTTRNSNAHMPHHIYLQVWSGDHISWQTTTIAIGDSMSNLIREWNNQEHQDDSVAWAPLSGALMAFAVFLIALPMLSQQRGGNPSLGKLLQWLFTVFGVITTIWILMPILSHASTAFIPIGTSFIAALLSTITLLTSDVGQPATAHIHFGTDEM